MTAIGGKDTGKFSSFAITLSFNGGTTGITYSSNVMQTYVIGHKLFVNGQVTLSNKGSSTGAAFIDGFPNTIWNGTQPWKWWIPVITENVLFSAGYRMYLELGNGSNTGGYLFISNSSTTSVVTEANFNNTSVLYFTGMGGAY